MPAKKKETPVEGAKVMGIEVSVDSDVFDDLDVLDALDELSSGNGLAIGRLFRKVLGDQADRVSKELRDPETGRLRVSTVAEFMKELMETLAPN